MFRKRDKLCSKSKAVAIMYLEQKARELEETGENNPLGERTVEEENKEMDVNYIREAIDFLIRN